MNMWTLSSCNDPSHAMRLYMICEQKQLKLRLNVRNIRIDGVEVRVECVEYWSDKGIFLFEHRFFMLFNF